MQLVNLPWRAFRGSLYLLRKVYFSVPRPDLRGLLVGNPSGVEQPLVDRIRAVLGDHYFGPNHWSYHYKGEILNLRRVVHDETRVDGLEYFQDHIRGFPHPGGLELVAHFEPDPVEHSRAHLSDEYVDWGEGMNRLEAVLEAADEDYDDLRSP